MFKTEIIYREQTLYIDLVGNCTAKDVKELKRKMYHIINQYGIDEIIINKKGLITFDREAFYHMLDDYDTRYGGKLIINE